MRLSVITVLIGSSCLFALPSQAQLLTGYDDVEIEVVAEASPPELPRIEPVQIYTSPAPVQKTAAPEAPPSIYRPLLTSQNTVIPVSKPSSEKSPVDIEANQMSRDEGADTVNATGDVIIVQDGRILRADNVRYDLKTDTAYADGNVVLNEESGDIHVADSATYNNALQDGTATNVRSVLADGSQLRAGEGARQGGNKTILRDALYTPCKICADSEGGEKAPTWGLVASKVTHDQERKRVTYRNARLEAFGVPIAYTPYFSHADGSVKQKSGFLSPSFGFDTDQGGFIENSYYWGISPSQDATFGLRAFTSEAPLGLLEYRKRWDNGYFQLFGSGTSSDRVDERDGVEIREDDEFRGHVFAEGRWDINDKWRSGVDINYASDDQFLREYDFSNEDVLENRLYVERLSGRNYATAGLLAFQDVRVSDFDLDQPSVLPELIASFKGDAGAVPLVKGQWSLDTSFLGLVRDSGEQDLLRASVDAGWNRRLVSDYGLLTSVDASVRADTFHVSDRVDALAGSGRSTSSTDMRFFPQFHVQSSYPLAKAYENYQAKIEPVVALTLAPNLDDQDSIPNEDSNDVQIDSSNLFESNRFPGLDQIEDRSRVTYGLRTGLFGYDGSFGDVFIGQSYQFDGDDNPFPSGSGLDRRESDIVGQISGSYKDIYDLNYRFQLGGDDLTSSRQEVDFLADWNVFRLNARYLFAEALEGTEIQESREQFDMDAQYYFNKQWRARLGARQDLGANPGLRRAYLGLDHFGDCLFWSLTTQRNLTSDASGDSSTEILFRIGLKNLGEFVETTFREPEGLEAPISACKARI